MKYIMEKRYLYTKVSLATFIIKYKTQKDVIMTPKIPFYWYFQTAFLRKRSHIRHLYLCSIEVSKYNLIDIKKYSWANHFNLEKNLSEMRPF